MKYRKRRSTKNSRVQCRLSAVAAVVTMLTACTAEVGSDSVNPEFDALGEAGAGGIDTPNVAAGGGSGGGAAGANSSTINGGHAGSSSFVPDGGANDTVLDEQDRPPGYTRAIIGVGYGGIRVMSRDNGVTWKKIAQLGAHGGDDHNLLVSVAWGKGRWIATFIWSTWSSVDGVNWSQFDPGTGCGGFSRVAFGNGIFVGAACSEGSRTGSWISADGMRWVKMGVIPSEFHTDLVFAPAEGKFMAWGMDSHTTHTSVDGINWTLLPGVTAPGVCDGLIKTNAACKGSFGGQGMWIRPQGNGLLRSVDGLSFKTVYTDDSGNGIPGPFALAWGWVP